MGLRDLVTSSPDSDFDDDDAEAAEDYDETVRDSRDSTDDDESSSSSGSTSNESVDSDEEAVDRVKDQLNEDLTGQDTKSSDKVEQDLQNDVSQDVESDSSTSTGTVDSDEEAVDRVKDQLNEDLTGQDTKSSDEVEQDLQTDVERRSSRSSSRRRQQLATTLAATAASSSRAPRTSDRTRSSQTEEEFGDFAINIGGARVEDVLTDYGSGYSSAVDTYVERAVESDLNPFTGQLQVEAFQEALRRTGNEELAADIERRENVSEEFIKGLNVGAAEIYNVPQTAAGLKEIVEYGAEGIEETAEGRGVNYAARTGGAALAAGVAAYEQGSKNPARSTGVLAGSLVGSAGGIGAASKVSPGAGKAVAFGVQPGEEIATRGATAVLGRTARGRAVLSKFPGGKIDNEEIVIREINRAGRKIKRALGRGDDVEGDIKPMTTDPYLPDERPQYLTGDVLDERMGVTGPSTRSKVTNKVKRGSSDLQTRIQDEISRVKIRKRDRVGAGLVPPVEVERESVETPEVVRDYDPGRSEVLSGSPRDLMSDEISARSLESRQSTAGDYEGDFDPIGEAAARRKAAERSSLEYDGPLRGEVEDTSVEVERERGAETFVEQVQRPEVDTTQFEIPRVDVGQDTGKDTDVDTRQDFDIETGQEVDTGQDTDVETERETETETETENEFETETETESEFISETEYEFETEFESETETESEAFLFDDPQSKDKKRRRRMSALFEREFEAPIATPDQLLTGDIEEGLNLDDI